LLFVFVCGVAPILTKSKLPPTVSKVIYIQCRTVSWNHAVLRIPDRESEIRDPMMLFFLDPGSGSRTKHCTGS
jgi:hypothetical protein